MKCTFRALFRLPLPSRLIQHPSTITNPLGPYVLVEYIEKANGTMLSDVWEDTYDRDRELRMNLFRNLAKINIDLTRKPLPRIGSFTIDDGGFLQLENRPLSADSTNVEADGRCLDIPRNRVYHTVDSYVNGLIHVHDHYLRHRRRLAGEIVYRMSALTMMRAISHHFFERSLNHGPFYLGLTDVHPVNILVDDKWNIMCLTDLEWASSQPLEFIQPPWWLIMELADQTCPDGYNEHLKEFLEMQEEEELKSCVAQTHPMMCSSVMKRTWESGAFWYILALQSLAGLNPLFYDRIKPLFCNRDGRFFWYTHQYWTRDATAFRRRIYGKMFGNNKRPNKEIGIEDDELCEKNDKPLEVFKSV